MTLESVRLSISRRITDNPYYEQAYLLGYIDGIHSIVGGIPQAELADDDGDDESEGFSAGKVAASRFLGGE